MTFPELHQLAAGLSAEDVNAQLRSLCTDARFPAVVAWLERNRDAFVIESGRQALADSHGRLAHAAGSLHALHTLLAQLAQACQPAPSATHPPPDAQED